MDHDAIDDIILLDSIGNLYIFYGSQRGVFTTQLVEHVYDLNFSSEAKTGYFTGAVRYSGPGFVDVDGIRMSSDIALRAQQEQVHSALYTQVQLPSSSNAVKNTLGNTLFENLDQDENGFMRLYEGNQDSLQRDIVD